ncbi:MAG: efflux RND transporter periplasmic adaptor subunit [Gemmatimonadaceae bacterium]
MRLSLTIASLALLGGAAFAAWRSVPTTPGKPASPAFAIAEQRNFTRRVVATGSVRLAPGAKIDVGARTSGVVTRLDVRQGMMVRRGDIILELDDREARLRLASATAKVADLGAAVAQAESDFGRLRPLAEKGYATPRDFLSAQTTSTQLKARLSSAMADENLARVQLGYMTVRAPESGIVASVTIHEGETVAASFAAPTFVTLIDLARLECVALVDETDIGRVNNGDPAEFTVDAYPGRVFTGRVTNIAPDATVISGVVDYETTIRITGASGASGRLLRPQMTASVTIEGPSQVALVVPTAAVRQSSEGAYVWRARGGKFSSVAVSTSARQQDYTSIARGLRAGDTVLTANFPEANR